MNIKTILLKVSLALCLCSWTGEASAQRLSVKSNLLGWASLSPNAGFELTLSDRVSLSMNGSINLWQHKQWRARHASLSAEVRYWLARPSMGHFIAAGPVAATYDLRFNAKRYNGNLLALGIGYGYSLPLSRRWNFEPQLMLGYGCLREFSSGESTFTPARVRWVPMITRLGISFVYVIR